ncbi:hypothetical protein DOY81_012632 [Sarcophaga bullata]|nr:hypothetical protein DOY81_012632 [Sarcophaga bullata]
MKIVSIAFTWYGSDASYTQTHELSETEEAKCHHHHHRFRRRYGNQRTIITKVVTKNEN